jgi:hypothetical protein
VRAATSPAHSHLPYLLRRRDIEHHFNELGDRDSASSLAARRIPIFIYLPRGHDIERNDSIFRGQVKVAPMVGCGRITGAFPS